jgi:hypothetical protein
MTRDASVSEDSPTTLPLPPLSPIDLFACPA